MNHINHVTLKKKALNYMKERRWDTRLPRVYNELKTMFIFGKENDIKNGLHIGLIDISEVKGAIESGGKTEQIDFLRASIDGIDFMIGGESSTNQIGKISTVSLVINNRCHVTARYFNDNLCEVEEFHESEEIETVLRSLENGIRQRKLKEVRDDFEAKEEVYKDRFTFKSSD